MLNLDNIVSNKNENKDTTGLSSLERNNWPFRMLIIGPSGSGKTNTNDKRTIQTIKISTNQNMNI